MALLLSRGKKIIYIKQNKNKLIIDEVLYTRSYKYLLEQCYLKKILKNVQ